MQLSVYKKILFENYGIEIWDCFLIHLKHDKNYEIIETYDLGMETEELLRIKNDEL